MSVVFSQPMPAAFFWTTCLAFVLLDRRLVLRALAGHPAPADGEVAYGPVHGRGGLMWLLLGEGSAIALATVAAFQLPWAVQPLIIGLVAAWTGIALRFWAKRTLGRFFVGAVVVQQGHYVVTSGPYAAVRHPGYAGSMLAMIGFGIATANIASIAVFAMTALLIFVRTIRIEEQVLQAELGDSYVEYGQRTARLVPGIW